MKVSFFNTPFGTLRLDAEVHGDWLMLCWPVTKLRVPVDEYDEPNHDHALIVTPRQARHALDTALYEEMITPEEYAYAKSVIDPHIQWVEF